MRLHVEKIEEIAELVLRGLKKKGLITLKADEETVLERMREAITADLTAEDALDREVEAKLDTYSDEMDSGGVDYRKVFRMLKHKLARERGIIL